MNKAAFAPNVDPPGAASGDLDAIDQHGTAGNSILATVLGSAMAICFYGAVFAVPFAPLKRYFLGHPVAVAATVLFWLAAAVLITKWLGILAQSKQLEAIRDEDLLPPSGEDTPAGRWLQEHDAGHVARAWLAEIARLPQATRQSHLVTRLRELLTRQSQRGTAKHLADDLRELSSRDADAAHDSLGLVRIIVWAIPMLGFLGTVIGITQTLGGLDFSNGAAAVENLKSGLYVAFDTTALGLVLSVVAIFVQFPIERSEQRLLAVIDSRVGHLVSSSLPSDEASDNQTALIADLCQGVQVAVAESLENQARLWRETIDEAQRHWQSVHEENHNKIAEAFEQTLLPALQQHASSIGQSSRVSAEQMRSQCDRWQSTLEQARLLVEEANASTADNLVGSLREVLTPSLRDHAAVLDRSAQNTADRLERQSQQWQQAVAEGTDTLSSQQRLLIQQYQALTEAHQQAGSITALQQAVDAGVARLNETNASIDRSVAAAAGEGMAEAMRILARAVDILSHRLAESQQVVSQSPSRRAA